MPAENTEPAIRIEDTPKRIRGYLEGRLIVDSVRAQSVWELPYYPTYYFPRVDVDESILAASGATKNVPGLGIADFYDVGGDGRSTNRGAHAFTDAPITALRDLIGFRWEALDNWFEEDVEVFVHARNPYTRLDILRSSRRVVVEIKGVRIADTTSPVLLFETGPPTRYYIPKTDVRLDLLTPMETTSGCPYKGTARYWSVEVDGETFVDCVWSYETPLPESTGIAGMMCFYNEHVDLNADSEP